MKPAYAPNIIASAYCARGNAYHERRLIDRAVNDYEEAVRANLESLASHLCRANGYLAKGQIENAIKDYNEAIRIAPNYAPAFTGRGLAYRQKGQLDLAIADYTEAIRLDPNYANTISKSRRRLFDERRSKSRSSRLFRNEPSSPCSDGSLL